MRSYETGMKPSGPTTVKARYCSGSRGRRALAACQDGGQCSADGEGSQIRDITGEHVPFPAARLMSIVILPHPAFTVAWIRASLI